MPVDPARVREARLAAGLSLAQLAGNDVSRTFIHFVENGRSRPSREVLEIIAERTGRPMSFFTRTAGGQAESRQDLAAELVALATKLRRMAAAAQLTPSEHEAVKLLEVTLRQGAALSRAIDARASAESAAPGRHVRR